MRDLSVLIPARNEMWLARTIDDVLSHIEADTEIIAVLDGAWPEPGFEISDHPRVTLIHLGESIGQRAATNLAARLSTAKFIMKLDAHCAVDQGFDRKLMETCEYNWTVIPRQYNLHVFDWKCTPCGHRTYQGPTPTKCPQCPNTTQFERVIVWNAMRRRTDFWRFDAELHFQYFGELEKRPGFDAEIADTMSFLGACWLQHRKYYWELGGLDERHGIWGQVGTELACKTWLSGGRLCVNKAAWFSHCFRTQGGDFSFPYPLAGSQVEKSRKHSRWLWMGGNWPQAKYPLSWLVDKFWPVPGWTAEALAALKGKEKERNVLGYGVTVTPARSQLTKGLCYYTDNRLDEEPIGKVVREQITRSSNGHVIVSVSLKPIDFGHNLVLERERGILTMFKQILAGLEALDTDIAFLVEHDVLYTASHFAFTPPRADVFYYNENGWRLDAQTGQALFYYCKQTSGCVANRELLVGHYRRRIAKIEQNAADLRAQGLPVKRDGYSRHMGFEPGTHQEPRGVDNYRAEAFMSAHPNIDLRHNKNLTPSRWSQDLFRDKNSCKGWQLADEIPFWGQTKGRMEWFLREVAEGRIGSV